MKSPTLEVFRIGPPAFVVCQSPQAWMVGDNEEADARARQQRGCRCEGVLVGGGGGHDGRRKRGRGSVSRRGGGGIP